MRMRLPDLLATRRNMLDAARRLSKHGDRLTARAHDQLARADAVLRSIGPLLRTAAETDAED
jgi:hypothetical protein